jgi:hypothetical protein
VNGMANKTRRARQKTASKAARRKRMRTQSHLEDYTLMVAARRNPHRGRLTKLAEILERQTKLGGLGPVEFAGTLPYFRRHGLTTTRDIISNTATVIYRNDAGGRAAEKFFQLLPVQCELLFGHQFVEGLPPKQMAKRIRNFLRKIGG